MATSANHFLTRYASLSRRLSRMHTANLEGKKLALAKLQGTNLEDLHARDLDLEGAKHQEENGHVEYFSLPGEIRNQIMQYALAPGEIYLDDPAKQKTQTEQALEGMRQLVSSFLRYVPGSAHLPQGIPELFAPQLVALAPGFYVCLQSAAYTVDAIDTAHIYLSRWLSRYAMKQSLRQNTTGPIIEKVLEWLDKRFPKPIRGCNSPPVPQLLATCKQAYHEGHTLYYTGNIFFLPRGPTWHTRHYFKNLQQQHKISLKSIGICFGFGDLTNEDFRDVESRIRASDGYWLSTNFNGTLWAKYIAPLAMQSFSRKLVFIRSFTTLEYVRIATDYGSLDLEGGKLKRSLRGITVYDSENYLAGDTIFNSICDQLLATAVEHSYHLLYTDLKQRVERFGWLKTRYWLHRGAEGQL